MHATRKSWGAKFGGTLMSWFSLMASDGHRFKVFEQWPVDAPRGMVIVLQEIFGVNAHIESVCRKLAAQGWLAVAPALFDRTPGDQALGYLAPDIELGRAKKEQIGADLALRDIEAVCQWGQNQGYKMAVLGFCWGGTLAWLAANRIALDACIIYYGTQVAENLKAIPTVPVLMHFGEADHHIPVAHVQKIACASPQSQIHLYPAGHGFNCEMRNSFHEPSATLAEQRTQKFLADHLGRE
jgi:carboxymethylenebutenolidase